MTDPVDPVRDEVQRRRVLSRWADDGATEPDILQASSNPDVGQPPFPKIDDAELQALHVRVIALENLVIALLAQASDGGREQARDLAAVVAPRPGSTQHKLTTRAAGHMVDLVERAQRLRRREPGR